MTMMKSRMTRYAALIQKELIEAGSKEQFLIIYTDRQDMPTGEMSLRGVSLLTEEGMLKMASDYVKGQA